MIGICIRPNIVVSIYIFLLSKEEATPWRSQGLATDNALWTCQSREACPFPQDPESELLSAFYHLQQNPKLDKLNQSVCVSGDFLVFSPGALAPLSAD